MFCPKCGDEFQPGFSVCPDCRVSLVGQQPEMKEPAELQDPRFESGGEEFVTVATFDNQIDASVARGALKVEGIQALVPEEHFGPGRTPYRPWAELKVRARDRDRAIEMLRQAGHR